MNLFEEYSKEMVSNDAIFKLANEVIESNFNLTTEFCRSEFSNLVLETEHVAYGIFKEKQAEAAERVIKKLIEDSKGAPVFNHLDKFFLSLSQSRKSRAGAGFENIIKNLFTKCGYPFEEQCEIDGIPDFIMPSKEHYFKNAPDCIIFTAKRTVRERWKQIATEGTKGLGFFLATIDDKVSKEQLADMLRTRIKLIVPETIKASVVHYKDAVNVISFEDFFTDHLDSSMKRWKRAKIIV